MHKTLWKHLAIAWFAGGTSHFLDSTPFLLEWTTDRQKMIIWNWVFAQFSQNWWSEAVQKYVIFVANNKTLAFKWKLKTCICYHELVILPILNDVSGKASMG